jgi:CheY-like chemotaxis protein
VLIVDDCQDTLASCGLLVGLWGHEVRGTTHGPKALEIAATFQPHAVLLDLGLPRMNGYEVAQRLRQVPGLERVVLLAVTGYGQDADRQHTQKAGFDHHLVKPVDPEVLRDLLQRLQSGIRTP